MSGAVAMGQRSLCQRVMLDEAVFCADFAAADKESAIRSMVRLILQGKGYCHNDVMCVANNVLSREELGTTGLGLGLAYPHGRGYLRDIHFGWFFCPAGIDFLALDGEPVYVLPCGVFPWGRDVDVLRIGECVCRVLKSQLICESFYRAKNAEDLRSLVREVLEPRTCGSE